MPLIQTLPATKPTLRTPDFVKFQGAALQVVLYAARRANNDVGAAPQRALLRPIRTAAVNAQRGQPAGRANVLEIRMHLRT